MPKQTTTQKKRGGGHPSQLNSGHPQKKRLYTFISDDQLEVFIDLIYKGKKSIKQAARATNIPYENAKVLNRLFQKEGRVYRINSISTQNPLQATANSNRAKKIPKTKGFELMKNRPIFYNYKIEKQGRRRHQDKPSMKVLIDLNEEIGAHGGQTASRIHAWPSESSDDENSQILKMVEHDGLNVAPLRHTFPGRADEEQGLYQLPVCNLATDR